MAARIAHDDQAAPTTPPECGAEEPVAQPPTHGHTQAEVVAAELLLPGAVTTRLRQQPHPTDCSPACHHGLHEGDRAGVPETARRGNLRATPGHAVPVTHPYRG